MEATWENRDLPVLDAAVQFLEDPERRGSLPEASDLAEVTGLTIDDVGRALNALGDEYLQVEKTLGGYAHWAVSRVYPSGRRAVGQWPTPENLAERIVATLEQAAENEPDEERRSRLQQAASVLGSGARDLFIGVLASVIARGSGVG
jgi:hypothetical protein